MKFFKKKAYLVLGLLLIIGCDSMSTFKNYAYLDIEKDFEIGKFTGRLLGKNKRIDSNLSIRGEKYELVIILSSKIKELHIVVDDLALIDKEKNNIIFNKSKITMPNLTWNDWNKHYSTVKIVDVLSLDYKDYVLMLSYHIEDEKDNKVYTIEKTFIRDYKEEEISWWDMIMSV